MVLAGVLGASLLVPEPDLPWRALMAAVTLAFAWQPLRELVYARGRHAVRHIELTEGRWYITRAGGTRERAELRPASGGFGPWIFLFWTGEPSRGCALIDARYTEPHTFRALKGWLRLGVARNPQQRSAVDDNC